MLSISCVKNLGDRNVSECLMSWTHWLIMAPLHKLNHYSRARLIRTANTRKNHANYPSMQIIRAYFTLRSYEQQRVASRASMRIKRGMQISEGQIIRAILYCNLQKPIIYWPFDFLKRGAHSKFWFPHLGASTQKYGILSVFNICRFHRINY